MHFSTLTVAALATLPSIISAFSLADISNPIGDVGKKCASQFGIPLMSCGFLPGACSKSCKEQLNSLEETLKDACKRVEEPQGLLLTALSGDLVETLCTESTNTNEGGNDDEPETTATQPAPTSFAVGPGRTATTQEPQLSFSGIVQVTSAADGLEASPTTLAIDTSVPDYSVTQTAAFPDATYTPTTLKTSPSPSSTSSSSSSSGDGDPFSSQEENSAIALRAGFLSLAVGILALIVNIA